MSGKLLKFKDQLVEQLTCAEIRVEVRIPGFQPIQYLHMISKKEAEDQFGMAPLPRYRDFYKNLGYLKDLEISDLRSRELQESRRNGIPRLGEYIGHKIAVFIESYLEKADKHG